MAERQIDHFWEEARTHITKCFCMFYPIGSFLRAMGEAAQAAWVLPHIGGNGPRENDGVN